MSSTTSFLVWLALFIVLTSIATCLLFLGPLLERGAIWTFLGLVLGVLTMVPAAFACYRALDS